MVWRKIKIKQTVYEWGVGENNLYIRKEKKIIACIKLWEFVLQDFEFWQRSKRKHTERPITPKMIEAYICKNDM